jgi:hypothetical protein
MEYALRVISTFNDRVQALLFNPNTLAPEYPASMITRRVRGLASLISGVRSASDAALTDPP